MRRSGNHLWSERYDRNIAGSVRGPGRSHSHHRRNDDRTRRATSKSKERYSAEPTTSSAYDILLRGIELLRGNARAATIGARASCSNSAIALDPRFALAHAYLALSLLVEHRYDNALQTRSRIAPWTRR